MKSLNNTELRTSVLEIKAKLNAEESYEKAEMRMAELRKKLHNSQQSEIDPEDKSSYLDIIDKIMLKLQNKSPEAITEMEDFIKYIEGRIVR